MKKLVCGLVMCFALVALVSAEGTVAAAEVPASESSAEPIAFDGQKVGKLILLNIIPGFGVGSFVQHDKLGGWVGVGLSTGATVCAVGTMVSFVVLIIVGGAQSIGEGMANALGGTSDADKSETNEISTYVTCFLIGAIAFEAANITWGIVRPIKFRNKYSKSQVSIVPLIAPQTVGAVAVVRF